MRQFALSQAFTFCHEVPNIEYVYPGSRTKNLDALDMVLYEKICTKLISIFHNTEHDYMRWAITTSFQSVSAEYDQDVIHACHNTNICGSALLTPDALSSAGTSLFKPNKNFDEAKYQAALEENDVKFKTGEIKMSTDYHRMFDEIVRVNNVYNTLILYEGRHYHAANQFFGKTLKDSRLAQVFFISKIDAQKHSVFPINRVNAIKV
jgi:hypothetical protein